MSHLCVNQHFPLHLLILFPSFAFLTPVTVSVVSLTESRITREMGLWPWLWEVSWLLQSRCDDIFPLWGGAVPWMGSWTVKMEIRSCAAVCSVHSSLSDACLWMQCHQLPQASAILASSPWWTYLELWGRITLPFLSFPCWGILLQQQKH